MRRKKAKNLIVIIAYVIPLFTSVIIGIVFIISYIQMQSLLKKIFLNLPIAELSNIKKQIINNNVIQDNQSSLEKPINTESNSLKTDLTAHSSETKTLIESNLSIKATDNNNNSNNETNIETTKIKNDQNINLSDTKNEIENFTEIKTNYQKNIDIPNINEIPYEISIKNIIDDLFNFTHENKIKIYDNITCTKPLDYSKNFLKENLKKNNPDLFDFFKLTLPQRKYFNESESNDNSPKPKILFEIDANTFFIGSHNQALLNENQNFDKSIFFQTIINIPLYIIIPAREWGKVEFNFTGRINTIWGSSELATTTSEFVKIGRAITETNHYHDTDRPIFWIKETWLKLFSQSEKTSFQIGFFPKQIGMGLILGNHYKIGNPILTSTEEKYIDQYRPGLEISTIFGKRNYKATVYYSMYKNYASFDRQVEFAQSQELCDCGNGPPFTKQNPSRPLFQASHLITTEVDIPIEITKSAEQYYDLHIKPFILYNKDRNQTVEFAGDAESSLITIGSTLTAKTAHFEGNLDIAGNIGFQDVKGWDRNVTEEHARMTQTHLFALSYADMSDPSQPFNQVINSSGSFVLSPTFPYPPGQDISLQHAAGEEFIAEDPALRIQSFLNPPNQAGSPVDLNTTFLNSFSRFRKCYRNTYRAFMVATDMAYQIGNKKINFALGYAGGDDNPNDTTEKAILYRLRDDWNKVRQDTQDHVYSGFIGTQSLYTGKHVRSVQLLRSHRMNQPLSQVPELTANQFSNLIYGGIGLSWEKVYHSGTLTFSTNIISMGMPHAIKYGFDPVIQDVYETFDFEETEDTKIRFKAYDERLQQYLGTEFNAFLEFSGKNCVTFYGMISAFLPGSYYTSIRCLSNEESGKNIPLKNQYIALAKDTSGFENAERNCISLQNSLAIVASAGIKFDFDSGSFLHLFKRRKNVR